MDPAGTQFRSERIPFRGTRVYCPRCHSEFEGKILLSVLLFTLTLGVLGLFVLLRNPSSTIGHLFVNLGLIQISCILSIVLHEFAHALAGRLAGLKVAQIWIGRGKTLFRARLLGFDTEFKLIPVGGLTFFTRGFRRQLRFRFFLAVLAGPLANAIVLLVAWQFTSWRNLNIETSIHGGAIIVLTQALVLIENLLPYRIQTSIGCVCTDGLSLLQLLTSKLPEIIFGQFNLPPTVQSQTEATVES